VSFLPFWRCHIAQFVEVCHEPVEAEAVQQVRLHERMVCIRNVFTLLQPCQPDSIGYKVLGVKL
jgi:hypothetical protein